MDKEVGVIITNPKTGNQYTIVDVIREGGKERNAPSIEVEYAKAKKAKRNETIQEKPIQITPLVFSDR